ncbi:hypothetical protein I307_00400 [Cryptococcus deuterogattii 99/473]|uniref:Uncharacterized protein n=1 Tax=Cryptococcus deuterogattii Ram5 TaxID=1296110 RepID=A0A0D0VAU3_9TREE|nr:hypothetical protein I309_03511 [Cryptococcus deuterogattii LA55]KIR33326.1 hypothetical protein I352_04093 [Cryptococcus deuterogattii MMRL2647]KIR41930.1 hypothetical protein I313_02092 [Cryptococcus deuterogattii Ram5]KIR73245.1 hypothetical protein I310_02909 [Cryptococcus deuterogattii CA1014]KIR91580.1 hypothetical protein I304_04402 [Cryptococcus deuterogattii CBS 10090]KIY59956.1 hypothetical protein I307_00400 [Cryptococcus deuterogattii 99/473]
MSTPTIPMKRSRLLIPMLIPMAPMLLLSKCSMIPKFTDGITFRPHTSTQISVLTLILLSLVRSSMTPGILRKLRAIGASHLCMRFLWPWRTLGCCP